VAARALIGVEVRRLRAAVPPGDTVLDIGAGAGLGARALARHGVRVIAVEPDPAEAARLRAWAPAGVTVRVGGVPEALGHREADGALMWHVLEHVADPAEALRAVAAALRPGAPLLVAVPNPVGVEARLFGGRWHGWEPARHRWHIAPGVLHDLMREAGFAHVDVAVRGGWVHPASLAFSLLPALDGQVAGSGSGRRALGLLWTLALAPLALGARVGGGGAQVVGWGRAPGGPEG